MGALPNMFSSTSGQNWTASGAPGQNQMQQAYDSVLQGLGNSQNSVNEQQSFLNKAVGQNGFANQSDVLSRQNNLVSQQQGLADQLQGVANGTGPNPAQAMLQQATNQNMKQAAGLVAGTKGINPALAARLAGQQAGQMNQNSAGQAAQMGAQQQLAGLSALGQQQQAMGSTVNSMGNLANTQVAQQLQGDQGLQNATSGYNQAAQGLQGQLLGMQANVNSANGAIQGQTAQAQGKAVNDLFGGAMSGAGSAMMAHGGQVRMASGGETPDMSSLGMKPGGPQSSIGRMLSGAGSFMGGSAQDQGSVYKGTQNFVSGLANAFSSQPTIDVSGAPQSDKSNVSANDMVMAAYGGKIPKNMKGGGHVPGKAKFKGDTLKNDTVPAMLSPGEMVVPRTIAQSGDPEKAKAFIAALMAKNGRMK